MIEEEGAVRPPVGLLDLAEALLYLGLVMGLWALGLYVRDGLRDLRSLRNTSPTPSSSD